MSWVFNIKKLTHGTFTNAIGSRAYSKGHEYEATEMRPRTQASCFALFLRQMRSAKFFFLVSCTSLACSLIWVQFATRQDQPAVDENLIQEALDNVARDFRYTDVYRKTDKLPKDFKYILLWTQNDYAPFYYLGDGQRAFLKNNCSVINCYVTTNRNFFGGNLTNFHAIAFNGRCLNEHDLPSVRFQHQKYIFFDMESADNYPVCEKEFDGFFNWTSTYRLDSDIPYPYILIRDTKGKTVGPKKKVQWTKHMAVVGKEFADRIGNKTKAAAWFVSHCHTRSHRKDFVRALKSALLPYGWTVDVYGSCGTLQCNKNKQADCDYLLQKDYFFYMSLENSFDVDYVTEKLLTALQHDVVPVVYGGADYARFLPPGSYIDGRKQTVVQLAAIMDKLIHSPKDYSQYFRWKRYYTYHNPSAVENVCAVCEALHDKKVFEKTTIYEEFRRWWNPFYKNRCGGGIKLF